MNENLFNPEYLPRWQKGYEPDEFLTHFEKIPLRIYPDAGEASVFIAGEIATLIHSRQDQGKNCVLGLATGSTPVKIYDELVRLHREEGLSFRNVITFNLDEYYPMDPRSVQSYHRFMHEYLFDHIDILPENIHIPDGRLKKEEVWEYCRQYDRQIREAGGIDLQLLGIGRTGHIGFNEPGTPVNASTRLVTLDHITISDAASDFFGEENVPRMAITMGTGTILRSKKIILLAWGEGKAATMQKAVEEPVSDLLPASFLQNHPDTLILLDTAASAELVRIKTPWLLGPCEWDDTLVRKAVVWLCQKVSKPILKLTDRDYNDNGLAELVTELGPDNKINIRIFNELQHTITGWPGGKPNADDTTRPERALPYPKTVLVFSPHPDDDVISMGGTLARLVQQGHQVHTVYQTSGSIAVFDDDVLRYLDFVNGYSAIFNNEISGSGEIYDNVKSLLGNKQPGQVDTPEVIEMKTAIRRGEARAACRFIGIPDSQVHFLNLPFYNTGSVKKNPVGEEDIRLTVEILQQIKPHQIYAAGDLSDPHGTHRVCLDAIFRAIERLKQEEWLAGCRIWLYRGAWQEWDLDQVAMAVPLSPEEVHIKRNAIFKHQSQKDRPLFPGIDTREFWQRAEERNHATAVLYDKLGMAEYQAIEVFVRIQ
ncbi:MAG: glucosamine-6-phosphate deaminase [Bacteroidetes bacterium]|nr:glucosamine-6-phosphate deaminase [Bacteroidota bacterium]